jgi:hypothetical protein
MVNFSNYSKIGFGTDSWEIFMEDMIKLDKQEVFITLTPPKNYLKAHGYPPNANIRIQYPVDVGKKAWLPWVNN